MRHIAIDGSSKTLGWVLAEDGKRRFSGTYNLFDKPSVTLPIAERLVLAYNFTVGLLATWEGTVLVVTEAPAVSFAKSAIPQLRVNGAVILACQHNRVAWREVSVTEGKKALTGRGTAKKPDMILAAAPHLGYDPDRLTIKGSKSSTYRAYLDGELVYDENEADAVGVMLASNF